MKFMKSKTSSFLPTIVGLCLAAGLAALPADTVPNQVVDNLTFNGQVDQDTASFILKGRLKSGIAETNEAKLIYSLQSLTAILMDGKTNTQRIELEARIHQGQVKELVLAMLGQGEVRHVNGSRIRDWSIRHGTNGGRFLVIRPLDPEKCTNILEAVVQTAVASADLPATFSPLLLHSEQAAWQEGAVRIEAAPSLSVTITNATNLTFVQAAGGAGSPESPRIFEYRLSQATPELSIRVAESDLDARRVALEISQLTGEVREKAVSFILKGTATVKHPAGGCLPVLRGDAALTSYPDGLEIILTNGVYVLVLPRAGSYPVELHFDARLALRNGWRTLSFATAPGALRPVTLRNLPAETQFQAGGAAQPERRGDEFLTWLPAAGDFALQWQSAKTEGEGKLFFAVQSVIQMAVGPGLLREAHLLEYKILQGETARLELQLQGSGEVTRITGDNILSWKVEPGTNSTDRRLVIQLNQPQKDRYTAIVQTQTPLGVFPVKAQPLRLIPLGAIRYGGHVLVLNEGAVRLEVAETRGLSQISREQFPQIKELVSLLPGQPSQGFAYRFSGADFDLTFQADNIQPELEVSEVLQYHLGETEVRLQAELALEILRNEAPLREFTVQIPADFAVSQLTAAQLSDSFVTPATNAGLSNLRLVFGQPVTGQQIVQLRLEKNQNFTGTNWNLPVIRPLQAKTVRGFIGTTADTGLRLLPGRTDGLTETAAEFFPRKLQGLQFAYRLRDTNWQAELRVQRLTRSVQVDAFHLFSISEGVAYGSSVMRFQVAGTPVSSFVLEVPAEYSNVEFAGRDVRNWRKTDRGLEVFLHTPVFGAYTLLATFDRKFNPAGDTMSLTGLRPLDVQSEQGTAVAVSEYQFEVRSANASTNAAPLEAAEIAPEFRLLFDAPVLAAYRYLGRPLTLNLTLNSLAQGDTVHQVVDRASFDTHVSHEGEVVTRAQYFVKSQGQAHLRFKLPASLRLWEATVDGAKIIPVADGQDTLVPLPAQTRAGALLRVDLLLAGKSANPSTVTLESPAVANTVLLTEWRVEPDPGYEIHYRQGDLAGTTAVPDRSGLAWLRRLAGGSFGAPAMNWGLLCLLGLLVGALTLALATRSGQFRFGLANTLGLFFGLTATIAALYGLGRLMDFAWNHPLPPMGTLAARTSVTEAGKGLQMQVRSVALDSLRPMVAASWLPWVGLVAWGLLAVRGSTIARSRIGVAIGWSLLSWAVLVWPPATPGFFAMVCLFYAFHVLWPAWQRQRTLPPRPLPPPAASAVAGATTAILAAFLLPNFTMQAAPINDPGSHLPANLHQRLTGKDGFHSVPNILQVDTINDAGSHLPVNLRQPDVGKDGFHSVPNIPPTDTINDAGSHLPVNLRQPDVGRDGFYSVPNIPLWLTTAPTVLWQVADASPRSEEGSARNTGLPSSSSSSPQPTLSPTNAHPLLTNVVRSLVQTAQVKEGFVQVQAKMQWQTAAGQTLLLLRSPAVLTTWESASSALTLRPKVQSEEAGYELLAREPGLYVLDFNYQISLGAPTATNGFRLPTPAALVNLLKLEIAKGDMDVVVPQAMSTETKRTGKESTEAALVLPPASQPWISWQPRSRDVRSEKAVFYAELAQLFIPAPGVIETICDVLIRPAQGQLTSLQFTMPPGFTITDVQAEFVNGWRFDPDTRSLSVQFQTPQSRPFSLRLRSQLTTRALPYEQSLGVIKVVQAAGQVGQVGIATGSEVQLDKTIETGLSAINIEDFSANLVREAAAQVSGLTLRRAFRSADVEARIQLSASPVEPDVRVQAQETLSLGEDRIVLAAQLQVSVIRAGIFKLSFALPPDMEVDSLSGPALSHWTDFASGGQRVVTLHLKARTEGDCSFNVTLSGPGMQQRKEWEAPKLLVREATRQTGQLVLAPELGLRLHLKTREGITQLDPLQAGIQQKGVLAFRLLQANWRLAFDVETVEPWVEMSVLQDVTVLEGEARAVAELLYQIDNAGVKSLRVLVPPGVENVNFTGENLNDTAAIATNQTGAVVWEARLQRRIIGAYRLKLSYQIRSAAASARLAIGGIEGQNVNLQRGYLGVHSSGRLQLNLAALPAALQRTEWQSIPASLRRGMESPEANDTFRIMEPSFVLNLDIARHEAARLLPARVEKTELTSVLSAQGLMLTQVRLTLQPGDKRLLHLRLPAGGRFWNARVNQESSWPWRSGDEILIPLEKNTDPTQPAIVEFLYQSSLGQTTTSRINPRLVGPQFDLPLENITWQLYVPPEWQIKDWQSTLEKVDDHQTVTPTILSLQSYLDSQAEERQEKTRDAESLLQMGNNLLQKGSPQQARRAYAAAWRLSQHDAAFNEDARVQLHNLKLQQALLGLNQPEATAGRSAEQRAGKPVSWLAAQPGQAPAYTQDQVQRLLNQNSPEQNQALMRLAERLVRQQDAAMAKPETIRAALPKEGRLLTFTGSLQVDTFKDLQIQLVAKVKTAGVGRAHLPVLLAIFAGLALLALAARRPERKRA
jgi:hypothetical protein